MHALANDAPALRRAWHAVAPAAVVGGEPVSVRLLGEAWVLVRLGGRLRAFPDRCPHRRVPLSAGRVVGEELECRYHGWRFDGSGACTAVPALGPGGGVPRGMRVDRAWGVQERYGLVWLAPEEPFAPLPVLPECEDPGFAWALLPPRRTTAGAGAVIDNFFDVAHFSFLHERTFGVTEPVTVERYAVSRDRWCVRLVHTTALPAGDRTATYTATAPLAMHLRLEHGSGQRSMVAFVATPESATTTVVHKLVAWPVAVGADALAEQVAFEVAVLEEDLAVVELIAEPALPLDLRAEQHTKADRASVELRRLLADLVAAAAAPPTAAAAAPVAAPAPVRVAL